MMMKKIKRTLCLLLVCVLLLGTLSMSALAVEGQTYQGYCGDNVTWVLDTSTGVLTISGTGPMYDFINSDFPWQRQEKYVKKVVVNSGVTYIGKHAFFNVETLESVTLPDTVTAIGNETFTLCKKLVTCNLPDSIVSIGNDAFQYCESLKLTKLPASLTSLGNGAFEDCESLGPVLDIPSGVTEINPRTFSGCSGVKSINIPEGVVSIGSNAFDYTDIQKVTIPSTVEEISYEVFQFCKSLKFVDMKGGTSLSENVFRGCTALEKINLSETLTTLQYGRTFENCSSLTYISFPASVTTLCGSFDESCLKTVCIVNPNCEIWGEFGEKGVTTIYGEAGSTAEVFAKKNGYNFGLLGTQPQEPADPVINEDVTDPGQDEPENPSAPQFTDVPANAYYADAVAWAVANNITSGTSTTTFSPNKDCDRGQAVTFLWRVAGKPEPFGVSNPFEDVSSGKYYYQPVQWAVENGITSGTSATTFSPNKACTRGEIVTFLWRAAGCPTASGASFSDVSPSQYYANAVAWAVQNGITSGTGDGKFSPNQTCTRNQIVTFLYRYAQ